MDSGASNEGRPLHSHRPGQTQWNNAGGSAESQENTSKCQLPLYYNTPTDANHPCNTPSPFTQTQEAPAPVLRYHNESDRYQDHHSTMPLQLKQAGPGSFQPNTSYSQQPTSALHPQVGVEERPRHNGCPAVTTPQLHTYQNPNTDKNLGAPWPRSPYVSPYPVYRNDGLHKAYGQRDAARPVAHTELPTVQSSSGSLTPHQHTPPVVTSFYTNNGVSQPVDGRGLNVLMQQQPVNMAPREQSMYLPMPNPRSMIPQPSPTNTPRHPNMMQFPHPLGHNVSGMSPYPVNSPSSVHGKVKNRANKSYQCPKCAKVFRRGDHLKRHLLSVHDHEHPYQCGDCGKGFASVAALLKHAKSLHVGNLAKGLMCLRCQTTFMSMQEIETHANSLHAQEDEIYMQNINTSSKQHTCASCSKTFPSASQLKKHMQIAHRSKDDSKNFCRECGKGFARVDALRKHIHKTHNGNPNLLPPDDLDDVDNSRQVPISKSANHGNLPGNHENTMAPQSSASMQWCPPAPPQLSSDKTSIYNRIDNAMGAPPPTLYQQETTMQQHQVSTDNVKFPVQGTPTISGNRAPILQPSVPPPYAMSPHNESMDAITSSQSPSTAPTESRNDVVDGTADSLSVNGSHFTKSDQTQYPEEQTVSNVFSMAMKTLLDFDYESSDNVLAHSVELTLSPQQIWHPSKRVLSIDNHHRHTGSDSSECTLPGSVVSHTPTDVHYQSGNKFNVSSNQQQNFLMTAPPPPDATMGCLPTQLALTAGAVQEPRRWLPHHQGGGGGVKVPLVNFNGSRATSTNAPTTMKLSTDFENFNGSRTLASFHKTLSSNSSASDRIVDSDQGKVDLRCVVCQTQYNSVDDLMSHVEGVHLKANPHECCICKKHFSQAGNVKRHIRFVHLRERPFRCKDCSCTFDRLCYLQRHMRTHLQWNEENQEFNPLKPCFCPECGKRCLTAHHLRGHMQRKHFAKNKQNYSEFLAKYGHLEALGNGPGALSSQRGRKGQRKSDHRKSLQSSMISFSSMENQSYSNLNGAPSLNPQDANTNLQIKPSADKLLHSLPSKFLQSTRQAVVNHAASNNDKSSCDDQSGSLHRKSLDGVHLSLQENAFDSKSGMQPGLRCTHFQNDVRNCRRPMAKIENRKKCSQKRNFRSRPKKLLSFRCSYCVIKRFYSLEMLRSHAVLHHKSALKRYLCTKCGAGFMKYKNLFAHKAKSHANVFGVFSKINTAKNNQRAGVGNSVNTTVTEWPQRDSALCGHNAMQICQENQRMYGPVSSQMNFFCYDSNSPVMIPSPIAGTMYRSPSHRIGASMPLIQT